LIETWSASGFDYSEYQDRYREKVTELVQAKIEGRDVVTPEEDEEPDVVNLMDALRKSVARVQAERPRAKTKSASRKRTTGKRAAKRKRA
jgi:DNA end-binding protein Ku